MFSRFISLVVLLAIAALVGAGVQAYVRTTSGPTFVDSLVARATGEGGELEELGREADRVLDKAKDAVEDLEPQ